MNVCSGNFTITGRNQKIERKRERGIDNESEMYAHKPIKIKQDTRAVNLSKLQWVELKSQILFICVRLFLRGLASEHSSSENSPKKKILPSLTRQTSNVQAK